MSPDSDKSLISPHHIATLSNIQAMGLKEMITKDKMAWF